VYNKTRSELGKLAANSDNLTMKEGAKGIQRVLDDAFDRQAPQDAVKLMHEARGEYAKALSMEKAMKKSRSVTGDIPPKQMYAQAQQDIPGFNRGKGGDYADLIRGGRKFLPDPTPNSGTPERLLYQNLVTAGSLSGLGALGGAMSGDGSNAVPGAALGLLGFGTSKAAQKVLNSPQLTEHLLRDILTKEQKKRLAQAFGSAGLLGSSQVN
jgi:hypothetical protein